MALVCYTLLKHLHAEKTCEILKHLFCQLFHPAIVFCVLVIFRTGTSDPYCIVKVDNEVVARQVVIISSQ